MPTELFLMFIRTAAILTGDGTTGNDRRSNLERNLRLGHYAWFPVGGQSAGRGNSYLIFNISLENALLIAKSFGQGSVVFIDGSNLENYGSHFEYWERSDNGRYAKTLNSETGRRLDLANAESYFMHISRAFNFQNPFFDGSCENRAMMSESAKYVCEVIRRHTATPDEAQRRIQTCIEAKSGYNRFCNRGRLYSNSFQW